MPSSKIDQALNRNLSKTGGPASKLEQKIELRVVVTLNDDFKKVLLNCHLVQEDSNAILSKMCVKFDNYQAALKSL